LFSPSEHEYRVKHLVKHATGDWEVLTRKGEEDEWDEWAGSGGAGQPPEAWAYVDLGVDEDATPERHITTYVNGQAPIIRDDRDPMTRGDFRQLQRAVRLGGTEFLQVVLRTGDRIYSSRGELDTTIEAIEPIDPQAIDDGSN
jgi:hypothetical protein